MRRYFTILGGLQDPCLESTVPDLLTNVPGLRRHALAYFGRLGYSAERFDVLARYLTSGECVDDASAFLTCRTIVDWSPPLGESRLADVASLATRAAHACGRSVSMVAGGLWLICKYGTPLEIESYLRATFEVWSKSEWAGRQVAAATPRLTPAAVAHFREALSRSGLLEGLGVLAHLDQLSEISGLDTALRMYVLHQQRPGTAVPLPKVLINAAVLAGRLPIAEKIAVKSTLSAIIFDPHYRAILHLPIRRSDAIRGLEEAASDVA